MPQATRLSPNGQLAGSAAHCAPTRRTSGSAAGRAPGQAAKRAQRTACGSAHSAASTRGCAKPNWLAPEARPDLDFGAAGAALPGPRVVVWRVSSSAQAAEGVPASTRAPPAGVTLRVACGTVLLQRWLPYAAQLSERLASSAVSGVCQVSKPGMHAATPGSHRHACLGARTSWGQATGMA